MIASSLRPDSRTVVGRSIDQTLAEGDLGAVEQFVARVLRRAHESAEARNAPNEARAILDVAHLFADELTASHPGFDRFGFVAAATEGPA